MSRYVAGLRVTVRRAILGLCLTLMACGGEDATVAPVAVDPLEILTASLPHVTVNDAYLVTLSASGGEAPYAWAVAGGSLPSGLTLVASDGAIIGWPTAPGPTTFTLRVASADGQVATRELSILVHGELVITTASAPDGLTGTPYESAFSASGGDGTYAWSMFGGQLPAGLAFSSDGRISGTPTASGFAAFNIRVVSGDGQTSSTGLNFHIYDPLEITTTSLSSGEVGQLWWVIFMGYGGALPYSWSVSSGALPDGFSFQSGSQLAGTPTEAGSYTFTIQLRSADGQVAAKEFNLLINP